MESTDRPVGPLVDSAILAGWAESATLADILGRGVHREQGGQPPMGYSSHLLRKSTPPITADDVRRRQLPLASEGIKGYDKAQVDAFLEAVAIRLAAMDATDGPERTTRP